MNKVLFHLKAGYRIGNYVVKKRLGSGWTAEAYLVEEVPTLAKRVLKIYELHEDGQHIKRLRDFEHYCYVVEQLSDIELLPRYYHMGHAFLRSGDGIGNYYMVQEYVAGKPFQLTETNTAMLSDLLRRVGHAHRRGLAVGDWSKDNLLISNGRIRMIDCDYGSYNALNNRIKADNMELKRFLGRRYEEAAKLLNSAA